MFSKASQHDIWLKENEKILHQLDVGLKNKGEYGFDFSTCEGKVGIVFYFNTSHERILIYKAIKNPFFFRGIPYKMRNR